MSAHTATPVPSLEVSRRRLLRWAGGGIAIVAAAVGFAAIAFWPASTVEEARNDGERFGEATSALYNARTTDEVDAALSDLDSAAVSVRDHVSGDVANQVADQQDALVRAADGYVGANTAGDVWAVDAYQAELDDAVDDLTGQAEEFRTTGPEAAQAFYEGVQTGLGSEA